jgi:hypothetical protein
MVTKMTTKTDNKVWNDPEKVDGAMGWLIIAAVGCVVFVVMGRNLVPYAQMFGGLASSPVEGTGLVMRTLRLAAYGVGVMAGLLLFTGIQCLEVRPQLLRSRLPQGEARNKKLRNAYIWFLVALGLDVFFCFTFWPPVNSSLGWGVFRGGFSMSLVNILNVGQTFVTLFGGMVLLATVKSVREHW